MDYGHSHLCSMNRSLSGAVRITTSRRAPTVGVLSWQVPFASSILFAMFVDRMMHWQAILRAPARIISGCVELATTI